MLTRAHPRRLGPEDAEAALQLLAQSEPSRTGLAPDWGNLLPAAWAWLSRSPDCELWGTDAGPGRLDSLVALRRSAVRTGAGRQAWCEVALAVTGPEQDLGARLEDLTPCLLGLLRDGEPEVVFARVPGQVWPEWERGLGLEFVRRPTLLEAELDVHDPSDPEPELDDAPVLRPLRDGGAEIEALSWRVTAGAEAACLRDAALVRWRFCEHPIHRHKSLALRWRGRLLGYVIFRERRDRLEVLDWQVPAAEAAAGARLLEAVRRAARALGLPRLCASFPEWDPWFERFQDQGFRVTGSDRIVAAARPSGRLDPYRLRDGWFLQPGDFALG